MSGFRASTGVPMRTFMKKMLVHTAMEHGMFFACMKHFFNNCPHVCIEGHLVDDKGELDELCVMRYEV
mgnify:CR=1 FL=1